MAITKKSLINSAAAAKSTTKSPKAKTTPTVESAKMVSAMRMAKATTAKATLARTTLAKATTARAVTAMTRF